MAERTIRKRNRSDSVTVISAGESARDDVTESRTDVVPNAVESNGTVEPTTINDYIVDESDNGTGDTFVDPASGSGSATDSGSGRKRRSDAGTRRGRRTTRTAATETTCSIANMLFTAHLAIGTFLHSEVFPITQEESQELAKALTNVTQLYDLPVIGEKALAWTNLAMIAGKVYGPRFVAAKVNRKKKPQVVEMHFETPVAQGN